jgi:hypothetical protein
MSLLIAIGPDPCTDDVDRSNKFWDMIPTGLVKVGCTLRNPPCQDLHSTKKLPSRIYSKQVGDPAELWWKKLVREVSNRPE